MAAGEPAGARDCVEEGLIVSRDYRSRYLEYFLLLALGGAEGKADPSQVDIAAEHILLSG
jgi:hypothetical protein